MIGTSIHRALIAVLLLGAALAPGAAPAGANTPGVQATPTAATIAPSLSPDRLRSRSALTYEIRYSGGQSGVPLPVRQAILQFPAGLTLELPMLRSCSIGRLRSEGAQGCPPQSRLGGGEALAEAQTGTELLTEKLTLSVFLGPPRNLQPTVEILAQGRSPLDERVVLTGESFSGHRPYGEGLSIAIAAIPTLAFEPAASIVRFTLTIGAGSRRSPHSGAVIVPSSCPPGGFPFAARFTYSDGSSSRALARTPCPS
jgi:hypothetical protein